MKSGFTAAAALALALAATTASAGVVISEQMVVNNQGSVQKTEQTVMVQGHKQKVINGDEEQLITDLDAGSIYVITPKTRQFFQLTIPPVGLVAMKMALEGSGIALKITGATSNVAGYACQDYAGSLVLVHHDISVSKCVASGAPGAKEFVAFQQALADKLRPAHLVPKGKVPDGIPVSSTITRKVALFKPPPGFPPAQAAKMNEGLAKFKPTIISTTVTKIEVKDLPADTFVVPAGYTKQEAPKMPTFMSGKPPAAAPAAPAAH